MKKSLRSLASRVRSIRPIAVLLLLATVSLRAQDYNYKNLHKFVGTDGEGPEGTLIQGSDGNFYGTTSGTYASSVNGANAAVNGTVFRLTPAGVLTTLHVFAGTDGAHPAAPLVQLGDGLLYGSTGSGFSGPAATVFRLATDGTGFATLTRVPAVEGTNSVTVAKGSDGNLYCTERQGGSVGYGVIFRVTPGGTTTVLYSFKGHPDGEFPNGPLFLAKDGNFYGCTDGGGVNDEGTVFRISPTGVYAQLHALAQFGVEGGGPNGLVQAGDGNFYGTARQGGNENYPPSGTVFRVTPNGTFTDIFDLSSLFGTAAVSAPVDPQSSLIVGPDGALYGTGEQGGDTGTAFGGVFRMTLDGGYTSVYGFDGNVGAGPVGGLVLGSDGAFYGTTAGVLALTESVNVDDQYGTVFKLTAPGGTTTPPPTGGLPTVTALATVPVTILGSGVPGMITFNISAAQSTKTVIKYALQGSAVNGTDYELLSGKVKIRPNKTSATVQIVPLGNLGGAESKKVKLVIVPDDSVFVDGTPGAVKVKIKE